MKKMFLMTLLAFAAVSVSLGESCFLTKSRECIEENNCENKDVHTGCVPICNHKASEECKKQWKKK